MVKHDTEARLFELRLEKLRIQRGRAEFALSKAITLYLAFLLVGLIGFIAGLIKAKYLNILTVMGFIVLVVGIVPYVLVSAHEEKQLGLIRAELKKRLK
jgi:energy-coupling factor transporter transmembrane protein EcfT